MPDWEKVYETESNKLPWYNKELDTGLGEALERLNIKNATFLDLRTGPGTQAEQLRKIGFEVTGSDISHNAIEQTKKSFPEVNFVVDDFLNTKLGSFDHVFDRGQMHCYTKDSQNTYLENITKITNKVLFLKTFNYKEPESTSPYQFRPDEIRKLFNEWEIESIKDTNFGINKGAMPPEGITLNHDQKSLFCVIKKTITRAKLPTLARHSHKAY